MNDLRSAWGEFLNEINHRRINRMLRKCLDLAPDDIDGNDLVETICAYAERRKARMAMQADRGGRKRLR